MPEPSFHRQNNRIFPTPRVQDTLFFDLVEISRKFPPGTDPPAYGTAHPNTALYPNHQFCLAEIADEQGLWFKLWYCATRASQESYNAEINFPYGGSTAYPRITRRYILPRAEGDVPLALGSEDPGTLEFGGLAVQVDIGAGFTNLHLNDGGASIGDQVFLENSVEPVLVAQSKKEIGGQIGSLYVEVTRVYDIIPGSDDATPGSGAGQLDNGYQVTRPLGTQSFLRLTWKLVLPREIADGGYNDIGEGCPILGYTSLILVSEKIEASGEENQTSTITRVYEGNTTGSAFPSTEYTHYQGTFYPGSLPPEKFIISMVKAEDTYEEYVPLTTDTNIPAGTDSPTLAQAKAGGTLHGLEKVEVKPDDVVRGKKSSTYYTNLVLRTLKGSQWDSNLHAYLPYTARAVTVAEAATLTAESGTVLTLTPYNSRWVIATVETPTPTSDIVVTGFLTSPRWITAVPFTWPRVLRPIVAEVDYGFIFIRPAPGGKPSTSAKELFTQFEFKSQWSGICKADVYIRWSPTAPTFSPIEVMAPTELSIDWPGVASFKIGACLHAAYTFSGTTGTDHPTYKYIGYTKEWEASTGPGGTCTDWPDTIVADFDVKPYKGGYLSKTVIVHKPY